MIVKTAQVLAVLLIACTLCIPVAAATAVSNQYLNYIETAMNQDPNWQDDPTLNQYTENCILHGARYNMGLVDYVKR
jgi:hypothetical protein